MNAVFMPLPRTEAELAMALDKLEFNTVILFHNWVITQGFWCTVYGEDGSEVKTRKLWLTDHHGKARSIAGCSSQEAAKMIVEIVMENHPLLGVGGARR